MKDSRNYTHNKTGFITLMLDLNQDRLKSIEYSKSKPKGETCNTQSLISAADEVDLSCPKLSKPEELP